VREIEIGWIRGMIRGLATERGSGVELSVSPSISRST
jgi:hypothetical protein